MATRSDQDMDDDFSELYKEYTGPLGSKASDVQDKEKRNKRSHAGSDSETETPDPNAVPTDFTSREAKVWEAKSKATERNWKKRKEEEMICKICGESGHFTQGCPSTLGANRKSQDFFERVPARERHVKSLFTEKVVSKIEKNIGCKISMEEKFIIVSGKNRLILKKGVDAVHKVIEEGGDHRGSSSSHISRSRSPEKSPLSWWSQCSDPQRSHSASRYESHSASRYESHFQQRFPRPDKVFQDHVRDNLQKFSRDSPQAYGNEGARGDASHSKSPARLHYLSNSYNSFEGNQLDHPSLPRTLEELEMEFKKETTELERIRNKEEDEENHSHREAIREIRESYLKKLAMMSSMHAKQWEEFLLIDAQKHQQQLHQQIVSSGYGGYKQQGFSDYEGSMVNPRYSGSNLAMVSRNGYPNPLKNYPSRLRDNFGDLH